MTDGNMPPTRFAPRSGEAGKALVTGSSRRVGYELALALIGAGWDVCIHGRDAETLFEAAQLMQTDHAVLADLSKRSGARHCVEAAAESMGGLDLLVCNAATFHRVKRPPGNMEDWAIAMDSFKMTHACVTAAVDVGCRQFITISDRSVEEPWAGFHLHAAAKMAIERYTMACAKEPWAEDMRFFCLRLPTVLPPDGADEKQLERLEAMSGGIGHVGLATYSLVSCLESDWEALPSGAIVRIITEREASAEQEAEHAQV